MRRIRMIVAVVTMTTLLAGCYDNEKLFQLIVDILLLWFVSRPAPSPPATSGPPPYLASSISQSELYFPQIASGGGYVTGVTLMHTDARTPATPAVGKINFYNPDGTARTVTTSEMGGGSEFNITIPVGGVRLLTVTSPGDVTVGSAKFVTSGVSVAGVATFNFGSAVVGVLGTSPIRLGYIPLNTRSGFSNGVAIQNPDVTPVNLRFTVLNSDGTVEQTSAPAETNPLPANGQYSRFAGSEMGFTKPINSDSTLQIEATSTAGSFVALPLVVGNNLFSSSAIVSSDIETPVVFPQVADGGGYVTVMRLFNPRSSSIPAKVRFFNPSGSPRSVGLVNRGTASEFSLLIGPKSTLALETTGAPSSVGIGMARVDSAAPIGAVATVFSGQGHLGVLASSRIRSARIPVNTTPGYNTGVALAAGFDAANFKMTLQNRDGAGAQTVQPQALTPLSTHGQFARYLTEMGFSGGAGLADSSLLVEPVTRGTFAPLALLDRGGVFSTTAAARQTLFSPADFGGNYIGSWNNSDNYDGELALSLTVNTTTNTAAGSLNVVDEFPLLSFSGSFGPDGFTATLNGGQGTFVIKPDGTLSLNSNLSDSGLFASFTLVGEFYRTGASGTFEISWPTADPPLKGTWILTKR